MRNLNNEKANNVKEKKDRGPIIKVVLSIFALVTFIALISCFYFFQNNKNINAAASDIGSTTESVSYVRASTAETLAVLVTDIAVTSDSSETIPPNVSDKVDQIATGDPQQMESNNDKIIESMRDFTQIDITGPEVAASICKQTLDMNVFIKTSVGWDESKYGIDYSGVRTYINSLISSMQNIDLSPENAYPQIPLEDQRSAVKFCIYNNSQYRVGNPSTLYKEILANYMKIGYPQIITINSIMLTTDDNKKFDDFTSNLQATIVTDTGTYFVYLMSFVPDGAASEFKILDMIKCN